MSLMISAFFRDPKTGKIQWVDFDHPGNHLAGFESFRQQFWGTVTMKNLGLTLLPSIAGEVSWLVVEGEEIHQLEQEAKTILQNSELIAQETIGDCVRVEKYANNVLNAIRVAREIDGGVSIG